MQIDLQPVFVHVKVYGGEQLVIIAVTIRTHQSLGLYQHTPSHLVPPTILRELLLLITIAEEAEIQGRLSGLG